jgi:predicted DNA-binding protein with PD1-like motif
MTLRSHRSDHARHVIVRATGGAPLPDALVAKLIDERVTCGWLRASGLLADVELRAFDAHLGRVGQPRRLAGPVQVIALESSIGLAGGQPSFSLRAVLARETDRGLETIAGEIVSARALALEVMVTALDDLTLERAVDEATGLAMLGPPRDATAPAGFAAVPAPATTTWSTAVEASVQTDREPAGGQTGSRAPTVTVTIPQRPARPELDLDTPVPEPGDVVDHFAFGRCDVIKSDGDRLHLRIHKDGRIREIALEMLRVTRLEGGGPGPRFKLERRL